jgi:hypothetical protein
VRLEAWNTARRIPGHARRNGRGRHEATGPAGQLNGARFALSPGPLIALAMLNLGGHNPVLAGRA